MSFSLFHSLPRVLGGANLGCAARFTGTGPILARMRTVMTGAPAQNTRFFIPNGRSPTLLAGSRTSVLQQLLRPARDRHSFLSVRGRHHSTRRAPEMLQRLSFVDKIPTNNVFWGILALNGLVFVMWSSASDVGLSLSPCLLTCQRRVIETNATVHDAKLHCDLAEHICQTVGRTASRLSSFSCSLLGGR